MITATIITVADYDGNERDIAFRGEVFARQRSTCHLSAFLKAHNLYVCNMVAYQQPTFAQSIHYHLTGEAI